MKHRHKVAAWILLGLVTAGVLVPPIVLFWFQPEQETTQEYFKNGTMPLDVFFLLDASRSLDDTSWAKALNFTNRMAVELKEELPHLRVGMGQFADDYKLVYPLSEDLSPFVAGHDVQRLNGHTGMANGLCGNSAQWPMTSCHGGAFAQVAGASLPETDDACDTVPKRLIIFVTDGVPAEPELTLETARYIKQHGNVTLMGILVQNERDTPADVVANQLEVYTLSSCCPAENMEVQPGRWREMRPNCNATDIDLDCPQVVTRPDYQALVDSVGQISSELNEVLHCTAVVFTRTHTKDFRSLWFLLLIVPMATYLGWQNILLCLSHSSLLVNEVRGTLGLMRPSEVELSQASKALEEVYLSKRMPEKGSWAMCVDAMEASEEMDFGKTGSRMSGSAGVIEVSEETGLGPGNAKSSGSAGVVEVSEETGLEHGSSKSSGSAGVVEATSAGAFYPLPPSGTADGGNEAAPGDPPKRPMDGFGGGSGKAEPPQDENTTTEERKRDKLNPLRALRRVSQAGGYTGKQWKPIRTAYIIGGSRMDVNYGDWVPPAAQLASRRGMDDASAPTHLGIGKGWDEVEEVPETDDIAEALPDLTSMRSTGSQGVGKRPSINESFMSRKKSGGSFVQSVASMSIGASVIVRQKTNVALEAIQELPEQNVAPQLRPFNVSVMAPLGLTCILLPLVLYLSGILAMFSTQQSD